MTEASIERLKPFIITKTNGYLSISMMMDLISGLARNDNVSENAVIKELNQLNETFDPKKSVLYFDFKDKRPVKCNMSVIVS